MGQNVAFAISVARPLTSKLAVKADIPVGGSCQSTKSLRDTLRLRLVPGAMIR